MKIPAFKPSNSFVHDYKVPCLVAKLNSSEIAGIGALYREEIGEDPIFPIYLRGVKAREISPWQQGMLDRLFERDELVGAVAKGMKDYENSEGYEDSEEIQRDGILPHLYLTRVIIDERQQEVIICVHTLVDGNLDEHGAAIHLKKGRWKFDSLDYLNDYLRNLDLDEPEAPSASAPSPWTEMDPAPLLGVWENKGGNATNMTFILEITQGRVLQKMKVMGKDRTMEFRWSHCVSNGSTIRLDSQMISPSGESPYPMTLQLKDDQLRWETWILKRKNER